MRDLLCNCKREQPSVPVLFAERLGYGMIVRVGFDEIYDAGNDLSFLQQKDEKRSPEMWLEYLGWALSLLGVLPLIVGGILNVLKAPIMVKNMLHVGFPTDVLPRFGIIKILIAMLSLVPSTSLIGVILATGWMGGAISAHVRVNDPYYVQIVIPILIWLGFGLRQQDAMRILLKF